MMKNLLPLGKKLCAGFLMTLILCLAWAPAANAQFAAATIEAPGPLLEAALVDAAANTTSAGAEVEQSIVMQILNGLAWSIAKMTIQSLTRSVVNWINSGFEGSPAFVTDLQENLRYLGDAIADDFLDHLDAEVQSLSGFNITSPFQDQINQKLRNEYYRTTASWGLDYTLNQQSTDPKAFIQQGNFSKGGFNAWFSATQNPSNNPFGAYRRASDQLWAQIDAGAQKRKAEIDWGKGFLPWRGNCTPTAATGTQAAADRAVSLSKKEKCPFNKIKTPGAIIERSLGITVESPLKQLELADSINEIVAALMGQLVNQVLGGGGLSGASQPSSGGGQSYINQATSQSQYNNLNTSLADGVLKGLAGDKQNVITYRDNWQKILTAATGAEQACGTRSEITSVMSRANDAIARAGRILAQIAAQETQIRDASQSTAADKGSRIASSTTSYNSYLSSSDFPTNTQRIESASESLDSDAGGTTSTSPSLYTQMKRLETSCRTGIPR